MPIQYLIEVKQMGGHTSYVVNSQLIEPVTLYEKMTGLVVRQALENISGQIQRHAKHSIVATDENSIKVLDKIFRAGDIKKPEGDDGDN